jgi:hypothetical protein
MHAISLHKSNLHVMSKADINSNELGQISPLRRRLP